LCRLPAAQDGWQTWLIICPAAVPVSGQQGFRAGSQADRQAGGPIDSVNRLLAENKTDRIFLVKNIRSVLSGVQLRLPAQTYVDLRSA